MTLVLLTLLSASTSIEGTQVEPRGWTKDGRYFVWQVDANWGDNNPNQALDAKTGADVDLGDADDLKTWVATHPLEALDSGRESADKKATADVKLIAGKAAGAWNKSADNGIPKESRWEPLAPDGAELRVERDGASWVSVSWTGAISSAQPFWSPAGRLIAWLIRTSDREGMDGTKTWELAIGPGGFPRVHVVAEKALLATVAPKVKGELDAKGFSITYVGKALKAREASVVYAAKGQEALAAKAAALIPGGATVDKLTWAVNAELVVALGKTATGAK